ncbi:hypothetical protein WAI453_011890 [Rhynchosporium graminicola]
MAPVSALRTSFVPSMNMTISGLEELTGVVFVMLARVPVLPAHYWGMFVMQPTNSEGGKGLHVAEMGTMQMEWTEPGIEVCGNEIIPFDPPPACYFRDAVAERH